jgi:hypothetical protein
MNPSWLRLSTSPIAAVALALTIATVPAQTNVHYPDDVHANPPQTAFPFYTPGVGSLGNSVRVQFHCPDAYLATQTLTQSYVTHVGFSVGGAAAYDEFVVRAGTTSVASLGNDWSVNLPDQRVQLDRSNQTIVGGGTPAAPVNDWVDFPLDFPFVYTPGDHLVVDLTTKLASANAYCTTTVGGGQVQRAYHFSYTTGAPATSVNMNGIKLRFTFAPLGMVPFGVGCSGSTAPVLAGVGTPQLGQTMVLSVTQALPNGLGLFVFGMSRTQHLGAPLPLALGGGCQLLVAADLIDAAAIDANGAASAVVIVPSDPLLVGVALHTQFAQFDPASPASLPFVLSNAGTLPIF